MPANDAAVTASAVAAKLASAGIRVAPQQASALTAFVHLLLRWNRVFNLTGIHDPDELIERHLEESLALAPLLQGTRIADVGTGAGLPGIPLAVVAPDRHFTLIESRAKRVRFLRHVVGALALGNASIAHCRVEDLPAGAPFDTVLARAVAPPAELIRLTRHVTRPGSVYLLLTAAHVEQEPGALPPGYALRPPDAALAPRRGGPGPRSTIVRLERLDV